MEREYPGYMTEQEQSDLFNELEGNPSDTFKFAIATWRNPKPLGIAESYQLTTIAYALLLTTGAKLDEFEIAVKDPEFWTGHRVTRTIAQDDALLTAIHFVKCYFVKKEATSNGDVRTQMFRCLVCLANIFGLSGEELARKMKEELVVEDED